jgi:hypothetical protein
VRFASSSEFSARPFMHVCGRCDERFTGYGGNKAACLFEMYLSGVSFYVLSDHFLIHQSHTYEEEARKNEVSSLFHRIVRFTDIIGQNSAGIIARYTQTSRRKLASGFSHPSEGIAVLTRHEKVSQAFFRSGPSQYDTRAQCPRRVQEN